MLTAGGERGTWIPCGHGSSLPRRAGRAGCAAPRRCGDLVAETRVARRRPRRPAVRARGHRRAAADRVAARRRAAHPREPAQGGRRARRLGVPARDPVRRAGRTRTPSARGAFDPDGIVQLALARPARRRRRRPRADGRPVPRRVHRPRPLRRARRRTATVDNDATLELYAEAARRPGRRRRRRRRAERDDGRPGRRASAPRSTATGFDRRAILAYSAKYAAALYGPFRDAVDVHDRRRRRPQGLPAGLAQRPRGAARDRRRHRRGRRHGDGQAGARLPRRDRRRPRRASTCPSPRTT